MHKPRRAQSHTKGYARFALAFVILRALCGFLLLSVALCAQAQPEAAWRVQWEPLQPVNGSAVLFRVSTPADLKELQATWFDRKIDLRFGAACKCWYGVAGIDLETKPGRYPLHLQGKNLGSAEVSFTSDVLVSEKQYPSTAVNGVPGKYVEPPPEVASRIAEENAFKHEVFSRFEPESFWSGQFAPPVATMVTAIFGSARVVNKTQKTVHRGLDFRAAVGTPVHAVNSGHVVLARNLYFEGNCVMIDHGDGLLTIYMHLSEFKVKEGESVKTGQLLGLSGNTGRVNGPHVHFAVRWQGMYLDPQTLLALHPPAS